MKPLNQSIFETMPTAKEWMLNKDGTGFMLVRPGSFFSEWVSIHISASESELWRGSFKTILRRVKDGRFHSRPLSLGLRSMTGCWQRGVRTFQYFGGVRRSHYHVIGAGDSLYLVQDFSDRGAYPISKDELETIVSQWS